MADIKKIAKLVKLASSVENRLPAIQRLKLAKFRLMKVAGIDDPQSYGKTDKDKSKESSKQLEDKNIEKIIREMDDKERFVLAASLKKSLQKVGVFDESEHPRDENDQFTSGGGSSGTKDTSDKNGPDTGASTGRTGNDGLSHDQQTAIMSHVRDELGDDIDIDEIKSNGVAGDGKLIVMDDGSEWAHYESQDEAREAAKAQMEDLFDDMGVEAWSPDFANQFITVSPTDASLIAQDEAEAQRESIEEELSDEGLEGDALDSAVEDKLAEISDDIEERINSDPRDYFVNETGMMSDEDFNKADFVSVDKDALFEASIDADGIGHTLSSYDGEERELDDGSFLYRIN